MLPGQDTLSTMRNEIKQTVNYYIEHDGNLYGSLRANSFLNSMSKKNDAELPEFLMQQLSNELKSSRILKLKLLTILNKYCPSQDPVTKSVFDTIITYLESVKSNLSTTGFITGFDLFVAVQNKKPEELPEFIRTCIETGLGTSKTLRYKLIQTYSEHLCDKESISYKMQVALMQFIENPLHSNSSEGQDAILLLKNLIGKNDLFTKTEIEYQLLFKLRQDDKLYSALINAYKSVYGLNDIEIDLYPLALRTVNHYITDGRGGIEGLQQAQSLLEGLRKFHALHRNDIPRAKESNNPDLIALEKFRLDETLAKELSEVLYAGSGKTLRIMIGELLVKYLRLSEIDVARHQVSVVAGTTIPREAALGAAVREAWRQPRTYTRPTAHSTKKTKEVEMTAFPVNEEARSVFSTSSFFIKPKLDESNLYVNDEDDLVRYPNPFISKK